MSNNAVYNVKFSTYNESKRIVYGVVYAPYMLDSYRGFADEEEVELLAYRFMTLDLSRVIDTQHDNIPNGSRPVESFIAREGDKDFPEGAWVLGVKILDNELWESIMAGEYNGFSMEIMTRRKLVVVTMSNFPTIVGKTEEHDGHSHYYYLELNSNGDIIRGRTSEDAGHSHVIQRNSVTEQSDEHTHRIVIVNK